MGKTKKQLEQIVLKKSKAPELFEGRTKEWNDIPERQYRSNQGRSDKQYESNMKVMTYGCVLFLALLVIVGLVNTISNVLG